jgi:hypothetical protein
MLSDAFDVPAEEDDQLWRVYARATEPPHNTEEVYRWFQRNFWGVKPPYWMSYYARSPWAVVWTLNVDDTFEAAYGEIATEATRRLAIVNWDTDYHQGRELNVVHLHGVVDRDEPRSLVFSLSEYAGSTAARAAWPLNFRDNYGVAPFVILGARLRDEPDIEAVVSQRLPTHPAPSFYVSQTISDATEQDMKRWGLIPVRMTAEDFAVEWAELTGLELGHNPSEEIEIGLRVGRQLTELRTNQVPPAPKDHDLLGGDEPLWPDIVSGLAAELDWIRNAKLDCRRLGDSIPASSALVYVGRRLTGRSTGLLALGLELRRGAWRTFLYTGEGRPDIEAIRKFAADGRSIAVLFDGMAEVAKDVDDLVREARAAGLRIACVAVDDVDREASIIGRLQSSYLAYGRVATISNRLTRGSASKLVDTLDRVGRLGFLEAEDDRRRIAHFNGQEIFDAMAQLENAPGFGQRVGQLVSGLTTEVSKRLVMIAAFASRVGHGLLAIDAARIVGMDSDVLVRLIVSDKQLSVLLSTDGHFVRTRHRWLSLTPSVAALGEQAALNFVGEALRQMGPRLSRKSQLERNTTAVLVGALMSQKNLTAVFPNADLDPWYESLRDLFGDWSGRYWEQRAIVARRQGKSRPAQLSKAESFALRASEIVPDSYSLTTLGTVLLTKAAYSPQIDVGQYYERAMETFERASAADYSNIVTWLAYLRYALPVLERSIHEESRFPGAGPTEGLGEEAGPRVSDRIMPDWLRVHKQSSSIASKSENTAAELKGLKRTFDDLTARPPEPPEES